jgi:hypothetical protein
MFFAVIIESMQVRIEVTKEEENDPGTNIRLSAERSVSNGDSRHLDKRRNPAVHEFSAREPKVRSTDCTGSSVLVYMPQEVVD